MARRAGGRVARGLHPRSEAGQGEAGEGLAKLTLDFALGINCLHTWSPLFK